MKYRILVLFLVLLPLSITFVIAIVNLMGYSHIDGNDLSNWATLVVEIGIGSAITSSILIYTNHQKRKSDQQQDKISQLTSSLKRFEDEQSAFRKNRHKWALNLIRFELHFIKKELDSRQSVEHMEDVPIELMTYATQRFEVEVGNSINTCNKFLHKLQMY